jgi:hypothetical protein
MHKPLVIHLVVTAFHVNVSQQAPLLDEIDLEPDFPAHENLPNSLLMD